MVHIVKYSDDAQLHFEFKHLLNKINKDEIKTIDFDEVQDILSEVFQLNLFNPIKVIKVFNCHFLNTLSSFKQYQAMFNELTDTNTCDIDVYLFTKDKLLSNQDFKSISTKCDFIELKPIDEKKKQKIINDLLTANNLVLSKQIYAHLITCLNNDFGVIQNEINKILSYSLNNKLDENEIYHLICNYNSENIFKLVENILFKQHSAAWRIYHDLMAHKTDEISIINTMCSQLFNMHYIFKMLKQKIPIDEIAKTVGTASYFVIKYKNDFHKYNQKLIESMLDKLYGLELDIKTSKVNKNIALKSFIINFLEYSTKSN